MSHYPIVERDADYLLAVKGNPKRLKTAFKKRFCLEMFNQFDGDTFSEQEKSGGRLETRLHLVSAITEDFDELRFDELRDDWVGLKTIGAAICYRQIEGNPVKDPYTRYYISSAVLSAKKFADTARSHWSIENKLHWKLDVARKSRRNLIWSKTCSVEFTKCRHKF